MAQNLAKCRALQTDRVKVNGFFDLLESYVGKLELKDKPQNIFNVDETNFSCDKKKAQFFVEKAYLLIL